MTSEPDLEAMTARLKESFPELEITAPSPNRLEVHVFPALLTQVGLYMKEQENFDHVTSVTGIDFPEQNQIAVIYHLGSYSDPSRRRIIVSLRTHADRNVPRIPSLYSIWPSSEYHERETHEMLGVVFEGHHDLSRLLLPEDWSDIPPLRKDFKLRGR